MHKIWSVKVQMCIYMHIYIKKILQSGKIKNSDQIMPIELNFDDTLGTLVE